jgi:hypothetical protein
MSTVCGWKEKRAFYGPIGGECGGERKDGDFLSRSERCRSPKETSYPILEKAQLRCLTVCGMRFFMAKNLKRARGTIFKL